VNCRSTSKLGSENRVALITSAALAFLSKSCARIVTHVVYLGRYINHLLVITLLLAQSCSAALPISKAREAHDLESRIFCFQNASWRCEEVRKTSHSSITFPAISFHVIFWTPQTIPLRHAQSSDLFQEPAQNINWQGIGFEIGLRSSSRHIQSLIGFRKADAAGTTVRLSVRSTTQPSET
jgi:hypothetical protein